MIDMPIIQDILKEIETFAPTQYQENYDNSGLITGKKDWECTGVLLSLDCLEATIEEAIQKNCNLILAHHPIVFKGLKSITVKTYVERVIINAIKNDIAIYACHTNIDNLSNGVSKKMADKLSLINQNVLAPKQHTLLQLQTYVPIDSVEKVKTALFAAGAGHIGNYSHCSFSIDGEGSYLGEDGSNQVTGKKGILQKEREIKLELLVPIHKETDVVTALKLAHPYEEVAYYLIPISNKNQEIGAGIIGELSSEMDEMKFLQLLKKTFNANGIRYTKLLDRPIKRVALCGGSGSFLLQDAIQRSADIYISADFKYHEFFDAEQKLVIADIGHYESEQFTQEIFQDILNRKYSNFAVHFSGGSTNPVNYL